MSREVEPTAAVPTITIKPTTGLASLQLGAVWEYRELLYFMVSREVKGRYRQMAFGPLWMILSPIIQAILFSVVFGAIAKLPSDGVPYPVFAYVALLPWQFFAGSTRKTTGSLLAQKSIMSKVYFPRLIIPLVGVISAFIDFLVSFAVLVIMMLVFRVRPTAAIVTLPVFLLLAGATALGVGFWLAGAAVKFRDVAIAVGFGLTIWQYLTPVAYSATLVPAQWQTLYSLNPMYVVVEGFRWAILGTSPAPSWTALVSSAGVLLLLVSGAYYFRRTERTIVDLF